MPRRSALPSRCTMKLIIGYDLNPVNQDKAFFDEDSDEEDEKFEIIMESLFLGPSEEIAQITLMYNLIVG